MDKKKEHQDHHTILLFDDSCNLCNWLVRIILRYESVPVIHFAQLKSEVGQGLLDDVDLNSMDTVVLISGDKVFVESEAALNIAEFLRIPWRWFCLAKVVPKPIRDYIYRMIARNRYSWFGRSKKCDLPGTEFRSRFLAI